MMLSARTWILTLTALLLLGGGFWLGRAGRFLGREWPFPPTQTAPTAARPASSVPGAAHTHPHEDGHEHPHADEHLHSRATASDHEASHPDMPRSAGTQRLAADEPADVVELTPQAYQNLEIRERKVELADYWRTLRVPARVMEKPGHSSHSLAAPVNGILRRVLAVPGQAISPGDSLVELRVTDEELSQAQLDLLQDITRLEVIATELRRLEPLIAEGSVSGRQQRELIYEQQQLTAKRKLHEQELLLHGLDAAQVQDILESKNLVRDFTVHLMDDVHGVSDPDSAPHAKAGDLGPPYTVERLVALPGTAVRRGDDLCELAYHAELYIQGQAFEDELDLIAAAADRRWAVTAEFGIQGELYERSGLPIEYLDNHVDAATQTFAFYVPIENEVTRDVVNDQGIRFRTWRFKPGQRAHVKVPIEKWTGQLVLPITAIVEDGLDMFVFRRFEHAAADQSTSDHSHAGRP